MSGAALVRHARRYGSTIAVPGNHDVEWWRSPLHVFGSEPLTRKYKRWFAADLEPELHVPGASFIGLNTAHGVALHTLTADWRDVSIIGGVTDAQLARCGTALSRIPAGTLRAIVMHHNPVRGEISRRFGITNHRHTLAALAGAGCELLLCGHDHQERVEAVHLPNSNGGQQRVLISVCGTLSSRSRGGRPCSVTAITVAPHEIVFDILTENDSATALEPRQQLRFDRVY